MKTKCPSRDYWWPHIKRLAKKFEEILNKKLDASSVCVKLDDAKLNSALSRYERRWQSFKNSIYGREADSNVIDRHKIMALYIESFLREKPFRVENLNGSVKNEDIDLRFMLANEYFSLSFMETVINSWHGKSEAIEIKENERNWFIILLNHFKFHPTALDILSLAQIIYYIERPYVPSEEGG